jgi:flagellar FliL protein
MSDAKTDTAEPKKKGGFMKKALIALVLLGAGGGGTYGAFAMGMLGSAGHEKEDDTPKLVMKGEEDPYPFGGVEGAKDKIEIVHGTGGSKYRTAYYNFGDEFTSNLAGGTALVQVSLAASTNYDGRVLMWLQEHETALRSRVLAELASTDEMTLIGVAGKEELQKRLTRAMNEVLEQREGFGGVENVYFRSFIVQ